MQSVLGQTHTNLELIVVDDGSSDCTSDVISKFKDARVLSIRHRTNRGAAAARNSGIKAARGELIAFQDSDDEWLADKLEKQVLALLAAGPGVGLVLSGLLQWCDGRVSYLPNKNRAGARQQDIHREILRHNYALTSGWCLRRECFDQTGLFDENLPPLEDWEWLIRYTKSHKSILLDEPLVLIHKSIDSISRNEEKYIAALRIIISKHASMLSQDPVGLSNLYYVLGTKSCLYDCVSRGRGYFIRALAIYPRDIRIVAALMLSITGNRAFRAVWQSVRRAKGFPVTIS